MRPPRTHLGEIQLETKTARGIRSKIKPYLPTTYEIVLRKNRVDALVALQQATLTITPGVFVPSATVFRQTDTSVVVTLTDEQLFKIRYRDDDGVVQWSLPALRRLVNAYLGEE